MIKLSRKEPEEPAQHEPMPELLTVTEVAELLKVSTQSVRRLQSDRYLPFFKIGGSVRFAKSDIIEYLKKGRIDAVQRN
jgi:excisionase family DNA binding protein